jgi:uncharacterized Ntn-hydrolase superfamily protein
MLLQAGVGVVASQNVTDPSLGPKVLDFMARGATASEAVEITMRTVNHKEYRQVLAVDAQLRWEESHKTLVS